MSQDVKLNVYSSMWLKCDERVKFRLFSIPLFVLACLGMLVSPLGASGIFTYIIGVPATIVAALLGITSPAVAEALVVVTSIVFWSWVLLKTVIRTRYEVKQGELDIDHLIFSAGMVLAVAGFTFYWYFVALGY